MSTTNGGPVSNGLAPADVWTFTGYRPQAAQHNRHTAGTLNPPERPQYQGAVLQDGSVAVRWHTDYRSTSVWACFGDFYRVHGHPEYGTVIVWDGEEPPTARAVRLELEADMAARGVTPGPRPTALDPSAEARDAERETWRQARRELAEAFGVDRDATWPALLDHAAQLAMRVV